MTTVVTNLEPKKVKPLTELPGTYGPITDRGITEESARKFGVQVSNGTEGWSHAYPFTRKGKHVATQYRAKGKKDFWFENYRDDLELFGQQAFAPGSSRYLTLTEGPLDAVAAYQLAKSNWPAVAVYSAGSAEKSVRNNFDYLNSFERIYIAFDSDTPGREAADTVARILPAGKAYVVNLDKYKDPCDYLKYGALKDWERAWWGATPYTPSGIVKTSSMLETILTPPNYDSLPFPFSKTQEQTYGLRKSEFIVVHAPSGVGKSTYLNEIEYNILTESKDAKIGLMRLEETNRTSALGLLSVHLDKRLHLPDVWDTLDKEIVRKAYGELLDNDRVWMYDHFGSNKVDEILDRVRAMHALGCDYIFIDHLSIIVSDQDGDERKQLDEISTKLKTLCMELNICIVAVIHQNRNGEIRGTAGVEQLANLVIRLDRDKESSDDWRRNVVTTMVQKNRFSGTTGPSSYLFFDDTTGRLRELSKDDVKRYEAGGSKEKEEIWT